MDDDKEDNVIPAVTLYGTPFIEHDTLMTKYWKWQAARTADKAYGLFNLTPVTDKYIQEIRDDQKLAQSLDGKVIEGMGKVRIRFVPEDLNDKLRRWHGRYTYLIHSFIEDLAFSYHFNAEQSAMVTWTLCQRYSHSDITPKGSAHGVDEFGEPFEVSAAELKKLPSVLLYAILFGSINTRKPYAAANIYGKEDSRIYAVNEEGNIIHLKRVDEIVVKA